MKLEMHSLYFKYITILREYFLVGLLKVKYLKTLSLTDYIIHFYVVLCICVISRLAEPLFLVCVSRRYKRSSDLLEEATGSGSCCHVGVLWDSVLFIQQKIRNIYHLFVVWCFRHSYGELNNFNLLNPFKFKQCAADALAC